MAIKTFIALVEDLENSETSLQEWDAKISRFEQDCAEADYVPQTTLVVDSGRVIALFQVFKMVAVRGPRGETAGQRPTPVSPKELGETFERLAKEREDRKGMRLV